jgi:hypothetical protein
LPNGERKLVLRAKPGVAVPVAQLGERLLAFLDRLAPQVLAVQLEQIERAKYRTGECAVATD